MQPEITKTKRNENNSSTPEKKNPQMQFSETHPNHSLTQQPTHHCTVRTRYPVPFLLSLTTLFRVLPLSFDPSLELDLDPHPLIAQALSVLTTTLPPPSALESPIDRDRPSSTTCSAAKPAIACASPSLVGNQCPPVRIEICVVWETCTQASDREVLIM